jgi:hypothetical protein
MPRNRLWRSAIVLAAVLALTLAHNPARIDAWCEARKVSLMTSSEHLYATIRRGAFPMTDLQAQAWLVASCGELDALWLDRTCVHFLPLGGVCEGHPVN